MFLSRRQFLKVSAGTVVAAAMADQAWARLAGAVRAQATQTQSTAAQGATLFPKNFLWGVEGHDIMWDFWMRDVAPETKLMLKRFGVAFPYNYRYAEDIETVKQLGFNMYRFSIEWARVEPEDGRFSAAAIAHYRRVLECCHENGITPMVTLHHGPSPGWTRQVGGWDSPTIVGRIGRYVERVVRDLGDLIPYYCTINEANLRNIPAAPGVDVFPMRWEFPGNPISEWCRGLNLLFVTDKAQQKRACEAHVAMREAIKRTRPKAQVGTTVALLEGQSPGGDKLAKQMWDDLMESVAPYLKGDDFLGVQNYMRLGFLGKRLLPPERELTDMGYECYPEALANVLREASQLGLPLIVTESGYPGEDDTKRIEFIDRVLQGVEACLRDGIDVRGYTYWSLLDNGDWDFDYGKKFGLIAVDHATQHRTVKPSARHLGAIAQRGLGRWTANAAALSTFELAKEVSRDARG